MPYSLTQHDLEQKFHFIINSPHCRPMTVIVSSEPENTLPVNSNLPHHPSITSPKSQADTISSYDKPKGTAPANSFELKSTRKGLVESCHCDVQKSLKHSIIPNLTLCQPNPRPTVDKSPSIFISLKTPNCSNQLLHSISYALNSHV